MNRRYSFQNVVDPATHLVLPLLILLAARQSPRLVVPLSILAIFPDFDALFGIHRQFFHNIFFAVLLPLAFIIYARARKPSYVLPGLIALFYLASHLLLDLSGVALLYPVYDKAFYFIPVLLFQTIPSFAIDFHVEWGVKDLVDTGQYTLISELGFVYLFIFILLLIIFRKEMKGWFTRRQEDAKWLISKIKNLFAG